MRLACRRWRRFASAPPWIGLLFCAQAALGDTVVLTPDKDNSMFSEDGTLSNGAGQHLFSGRTNFTGSRRALLAFDIAGSVPTGSTINDTSLTLHISLSPLGPATDHPFSLHRVIADWGEGASDAIGAEGTGVAAEPGDATWTDRFFPGTLWTTEGGDHVASASAAILVLHTSDGLATWGSTSAMVTDVQGWLDSPASNFGWVLIGDETTTTTARRFDSKENPTEANRPALTVLFTPPPAGVGAVPDGDDVPGVPLTLGKAGGDLISLAWGGSCPPGAPEYAVYEGVLDGTFTNHTPLLCSTGGATGTTVTPMVAASSYYLVVPRDASVEGSYGRNSSNIERGQGPAFCRPQVLGACP